MAPSPSDSSGSVWYVAYGSNLWSTRLQRYLDQCPPAAAPLGRCAMVLPNRLFFAGFSTQWGGGRAFIDPEPTSGTRTHVTAWLVRVDQFEGIFQRENALSEVVPFPEASLAPGETTVASAGRYGLVLACPSPDDRPALTFTTPDRPLPAETPPSVSYRETIVRGLIEGHGLDESEAHGYLDQRSV